MKFTPSVSGKGRLAAACTIPFSNGTEGDAWMSKWCAYCVHDHAIHAMYDDNPPAGSGCDLILSNMADHSFWPEMWLPEPDDGQFSLPSRMICGQFSPCTKDGCTGDPGAVERAERVATVTAYWQKAAAS